MRNRNASLWLGGEPHQVEARRALERLRKAVSDPTLSVGDVVFCNGTYATVRAIQAFAPGQHSDSHIRNDWYAVKVITDNGVRWTGREPEPAPQSGYTSCACRDCMDTTVSSDVRKPELCTECTEAGCEAYIERPNLGTGQYECQRPDAYGEA